MPQPCWGIFYASLVRVTKPTARRDLRPAMLTVLKHSSASQPQLPSARYGFVKRSLYLFYSPRYAAFTRGSSSMAAALPPMVTRPESIT